MTAVPRWSRLRIIYSHIQVLKLQSLAWSCRTAFERRNCAFSNDTMDPRDGDVSDLEFRCVTVSFYTSIAEVSALVYGENSRRPCDGDVGNCWKV